MATEHAHAWTAEAGLLLPADGLRLLGHPDGGVHGGRGFLVSRADGQIVALPLLPYLIMAAIAEGGVDGGWNAEQVGARVRTASGQGLTADTVRYLVAGKLAPLGLIAPAGPSQRAGTSSDDAGRLPLTDGLPGWTAAGTRLPLPQWACGAGARMLSWPVADRIGRRRWAIGLGAAAVLVCVAATAPIMAETSGGTAGSAGAAVAALSGSALSSAPVTEAGWRQAAAWVAAQVSPDVMVACDPDMCRQLRRDGFPAARLTRLSAGRRTLPGSGLVVATAAVRSQFGTRLATALAPEVIAGFGAGPGRVEVRTIAPAGAAAFRVQLTVEQAALASAGRQLLGNRNVQASPSARAALLAGRVDARLLTILALVCAQRPIRLASFTGAAGADPGVPLRGAEIGVASPAARSAVIGLLDAQQGAYRPAVVTAVAGGTDALVAVRFDAPAAMNISQP